VKAHMWSASWPTPLENPGGVDDQGRFGKRAQNFIGALAQIKSGVVPTKAIIPDDSTRALRIGCVAKLSSAQKILLNPLGLKIPKHFRVP
jgi:hypothetical protein